MDASNISPPLFCPMCRPEQVAFVNARQLKIHLSSNQHFGCFPYECCTCKGRFAVHEELREHSLRAHGREWTVSPSYLEANSKEKGNRLVLDLLLRHAIAVQQGLSQPLDTASTVTLFNHGVDRVRPIAEPFPLMQALAQLGSTPVQLHDSNDGGAVEAGAIIEPPIPPTGRKCASETCDAVVEESYSAQRQHVIEAHSVGVNPASGQMQTHLKMLLPKCFPGARILNDMTCTDCGLEVKGALERAGEHQSVHVRECHLKEAMGLRCPVAACPDHNTAQLSLAALLHHIKHHHGGVMKLPRNTTDVYRQMRRRALVLADEAKSRFFPFTPEIDATVVATAPANHSHAIQTTGDEGEGEPRQKRVRFSDEEPQLYLYEPTYYKEVEESGEENSSGEGDLKPKVQGSAWKLVLDLTGDDDDEEESDKDE